MIAHLDGEDIAREVANKVNGLCGLKFPPELLTPDVAEAETGPDGFSREDFERDLRKVSRKIGPK